MSGGIAFRFQESASMRIAMEQGLYNAIPNEIRAKGEHLAMKDMPAYSDGVYGKEIEFALPGIHAAFDSGNISEIKTWKKRAMTFIEIVIPSVYQAQNLNVPSITKEIAVKEISVEFDEAKKPEQKDEVDFENISVIGEFSSSPKFALDSGFEDVINLLEEGEIKSSFKSLEGATDFSLALPLHEDMMSLDDLMTQIRKREKVKVKREKIH